jgi:hypothetical protein
MKRIFISLWLMTLGLGHAEVPKLLTERTFTSATLAEAVNHYVAIGEPAALKELQNCAAEDAEHNDWISNRGFNVGERIGWICRILYEPQGHSALRAPKFGVLNIPEKTMPADKWPLYPLAFSGSTYLVLNQHYTPDGTPEEATHYLDYCRRNGVFRKSPISVPTEEQAMVDAAALRQTAAWKAIKWQDNDGYSYPMGEQFTWAFLQKQAKFISNQTQLAEKKPVLKTGLAIASVK